MKENHDITKTIEVSGYPIYKGKLTEIGLSQKTLINTINQYSFCLAEKDVQFKETLQNCDILLPDGIAIVLATKIITGQKIKKIAGADIHHYLLKELDKNGGRCFYLGSSENTLQKIKERLSREFPNVSIEVYSPPFKPSFSDLENQQMIEVINTFRPDVLFVGMTAPKQEKWSFENKEFLDTSIICSIGAVFDFYAGTIERPNKIWVNLGLEWFVRLIKEPKRMWKRYLYYGPIFIVKILKEKLNFSKK